jgi:dihydroflavonol-4-reductase
VDFVTGGTGFVGAHVVRVLLARGRTVRCLVRASSRLANLEGLPVEIVTGDVADPASLKRAMTGARAVFHCAADYRLAPRVPREIYSANVEGTRNVLAGAAELGVERVVYTSSVGALGLSSNGSPANEETSVNTRHLIGHYKKSKHEAERIAREFAAKGLPVVIVNPSTPVGEMDIKPTPTGQMIVDFLNRRMPAYVETGLNVVDVRDVAEGHVLAAEKGRVGERYILGNRDMTLKEIFDALSALTGIPSPTVRLPHWIPLAAAAVDTFASRLAGRQPRVPLEGVRMSRHRMFFDSGKAVRELDFPQTPVEQALARAVAWFREKGYVQN